MKKNIEVKKKICQNTLDFNSFIKALSEDLMERGDYDVQDEKAS